MRFDGHVDFLADIWMPACALYKLPAGHSPFNSPLHSDMALTAQYGQVSREASRAMMVKLRVAAQMVRRLGWSTRNATEISL